jgi:hypothetical protein
MASIRVQHFFALVNDRLLEGKHLDQLTAFWEEAHRYPKCQTLVLKGERQGQVCGKACIKDKNTCMCHSPRPPKKEKPVEHRERCCVVAKKGQCKRFVVDGDKCKVHQPKEIVFCSFVLKSGERKGTNCGKVCSFEHILCPRHSKENVVSIRVVEEPIPVVEASSPVVKAKIPVVKAKIPVVEEKTIRVVEEPSPVVKESSPVVETKSIPVVKAKIPVVETSSPVVENTSPEVKESSPVVETKTSPANDAPNPSNLVGTCDWMMKSGAKKGQLCGKKCVAEKKQCVLHM